MFKTYAVGRLICDPEKTEMAGKEVTKIKYSVTMAVKEKETGYWKTVIVESILSGAKAQTAWTDLRKGSRVFISGNYTEYEYETKDGNKGMKRCINYADEILFLDPKPVDKTTTEDVEKKPAKKAKSQVEFEEIDLGELPF